MTRLVTTLAIFLLPLVVFADEPHMTKGPVAALTVPERLALSCVTIQAHQHTGSGTLFSTRDGRVWVLTAGHVIQDDRQAHKVIDEEGHEKNVITFPDVSILQLVKEDGKVVERHEFTAKVIRYSSPDYGQDLALLRVNSKAFYAPYAVPSFVKTIPTVGTWLVHCGSMCGSFGNNSITEGVMSGIGREIEGKEYDQSSAPAIQGSSGGPVVRLDTGEYVGMVVLGGKHAAVNFIVPARRILDWANAVGVGFIANPKEAILSDKDLKKFPIEEPESTARDNYSLQGGYDSWQAVETFLRSFAKPLISGSETTGNTSQPRLPLPTPSVDD